MTHETYRALGILIGCAVALQTFFGCWIWCIASIDKHLGFSSGWLPSATAGFFAFFLARSNWPFFAIAMMLGALFLVAIVVVPPVASWSWLRRPQPRPQRALNPQLPIVTAIEESMKITSNDNVPPF